MFLDRLTLDEKKMYLALAKKAAEANNIIEEAEKEFLNDYRVEMCLDESDDVSKDIEAIVDVFRKADNSHKRIVLFEAIAFMYVDGTYDDVEKQFVNEFAKEIGFDDKEVEKIAIGVKKYVECVIEVSECIFED